MTTNFFHPSVFLLFLDPGSEIRDPRSEIRDPGWVKIRILDKHSGSATMVATRVGKNPGFFKKTQPSGFFWVSLGFFGVFWVFLGFFAQTRGFIGFFPVS
jgi:hypothetical protein